jgi:hypothetical protein
MAVGILFTFVLSYLAFAVADHAGTPKIVRYLRSPGFVLGMRCASGDGWLDWLSSFGLIAVLTDLVYYGFLVFIVLRKLNWPKMPDNRNHGFWLQG